MKNAAIGLIVVGLLSLVMSALWPMISPKPPELTEEQAEQFTQAIGDAHGARATAAGVDPESKKLIDEQKEARASAIRTRDLGVKVFKIAGIVIALIGAGLFFWVAQTED